MGFAPSTTGIYLIRNLLNGHAYVGSAVNIRKRWYEHRWALADGGHKNRHLQAAWAKYGADAFAFEVVRQTTVDDLILAEREVIMELAKTTKLYNHVLVPEANSVGTRHTEATRARVSRAAKAAMANPVVKARHREATRAAMANPELRARMSAAKKGGVVPSKQVFVVTEPDGTEIKVVSLRSYAIQKGFRYSAFYAAMKHNRPHKNHYIRRGE